jgi:hypothetical protein
MQTTAAVTKRRRGEDALGKRPSYLYYVEMLCRVGIEIGQYAPPGELHKNKT